MMRPNVLFPFFADISSLPGIGPKARDRYYRLVGHHVLDMLHHLPVAIKDRSHMPRIPLMQDGEVVTAIVEIGEYVLPHSFKKSNAPIKIRCFNDSGALTLVFFHAYIEYIKKMLPVGEKRVISGKVEKFGYEIQMVHPDHIGDISQLESIARVEPKYPLTVGLTHKSHVKALTHALGILCELPEWIEPSMLQAKKWKSWQSCMFDVHHPVSEDEVMPDHSNRCRLAYDEFLAYQLALKLARRNLSVSQGQPINATGCLRSKALSALPFTLTNGQLAVIDEINADQTNERRMMRLLQGDVGSGKTAVALFAILHAIEAGKQAALMAPTEVLAKQHAAWFQSILDEIGVSTALLSAGVKTSKRKSILEGIKNGDIDLVIGTHALFQDSVIFKELSLVIVDEQHRFGVNQRLALANKGDNTDVLLMTATPIPRTLTMTLYGDMDCSVLHEKPKGRKEIDTRIVSGQRMPDVLQGIKRALAKGEKIYWICPLIEESEQATGPAVEERGVQFAKYFGAEKVGVVHGKMDEKERDKVLLSFRDGEIAILLATTVVEVGVDVPDATIMIIENAEHFGLSQLHQLRGRVGRGDKESSCVLLYNQLSKTSRRRLEVMRNSNDGFYLAEEDLKARGAGDLLGTKQSGLPQFKFVNFAAHYDLLKAANDDVKLILERDPELVSARGEALRVLLYLFRYDSLANYLVAA